MIDQRTLILMVGLPRSGKTTVARSLGHPIVNPDSIRWALHAPEPFLKGMEPFVWGQATIMVKALFGAGHSHVIVDATNITRSRREFWANAGGWRMEYYSINTSFEECIARAQRDERLDLVPVIERMAASSQAVENDERLEPLDA